MGKLYLVGPLGDVWQDVPLRARRVLQESSLIVGRHIDPVREWLRQGGIHTPLHDISDGEATALLLKALCRGDVSWLLQAMSDLAEPARGVLGQLIERRIELLSVPGPSNAIAGLAVSGLPADSLTFFGALPEHSDERRALFEAAAHDPRTLVCETKAQGLPEVLRDLLASLGDRRVTLHDGHDTWRGQASRAHAWLGEGPLALAIEGAGHGPAWSMERVGGEVHKLLAAGGAPREVAREVARRSGRPRREVYRYIVSISKED